MIGRSGAPIPDVSKETFDAGLGRLRLIVGVAGGVYLFWWFMVELTLPGTYNPLPGRLVVVGLDAVLLGASYANRWVGRHLSTLFTAWVCVLVAHYCYLVVGNHGDTAWWVGTFVTFAATSMCLQTPREVAAYSVFAMAAVLYAASVEGQLAHSIYVPGLATILLLANVTKRSQAAAQEATSRAERARAAAVTANGELEAFNYSVAHDLRAPLRAIAGFSQIVVEDHAAALPASAQDQLRRVRDAATHMARLIDGMLTLGHVSRADLRSESVDLSALARTSAERLRASQPERLVELAIADGLAERGDSALLGAAIENLIGNAWKFTRDQPRPRIEFGSERRGDRVVYFVRDNGVGFDMAFASKLFGLFQRLHTTSEFEGTGIGLATVQRIVQRHGGRVWAESKLGEGACFRFTLGEGGP